MHRNQIAVHFILEFNLVAEVNLLRFDVAKFSNICDYDPQTAYQCQHKESDLLDVFRKLVDFIIFWLKVIKSLCISVHQRIRIRDHKPYKEIDLDKKLHAPSVIIRIDPLSLLLLDFSFVHNRCCKYSSRIPLPLVFECSLINDLFTVVEVIIRLIIIERDVFAAFL